MRRFLAVIAALMLCACASADVSRFTPADQRITKKVTLDVDHVRLQEVADSLSKQSGVAIRAGTGERDWKVRERRVCIHAKDVPLGKVLDQIALLLGYCVSRDGKENEWTYTIWQDKKGRDLESELLNAQREEAAQHIAKSRQGTIDLAKDALNMSPEEAMKQRDKNPILAYMGGTKTGRGFSIFLSQFRSAFPTEYDLMMRGKPVHLPLSGLPADMQRALADMTSGGMAKACADIRTQIDGPDLPELAPYEMFFRPANSDSGSDVENLGFGGLVFINGLEPNGKPSNNEFGGGIPMSACALTDPDSPLGKMIGDMMLDIESGKSIKDANRELNERANNNPEFATDALAHDSPTEKDPPTDPELIREVEIKDVMNSGGTRVFAGPGTEKYQWKMLAEISRATGYSLLKETFSNEMVVLGLFVRPGKQPLYKVLIGLEKAGCIWDRDDDTLRIRPSNWALLRSYEIPESFMAFNRGLIEKNGYLDISDVSAIASSLTDEQIDHTFVADPDLGFLRAAISGSNRRLLRFYASLTSKQKDAIAVAPGLAFGSLTDAQWAILDETITDQFGGLYVTDGSVFLKPQSEVEISVGSQSRAFEITAQIQDEKEPRRSTHAMYMPGKKGIAELKEARKKAEEAAKAAEQQKSAQPSETAQPAPAK